MPLELYKSLDEIISQAWLHTQDWVIITRKRFPPNYAVFKYT